MDVGLPPCAGVALGFDRLVMLAAGKRIVAEVIPFSFDRA
jgi:lysyl-tRNA synthetase class 2